MSLGAVQINHACIATTIAFLAVLRVSCMSSAFSLVLFTRSVLLRVNAVVFIAVVLGMLQWASGVMFAESVLSEVSLLPLLLSFSSWPALLLSVLSLVSWCRVVEGTRRELVEWKVLGMVLRLVSRSRVVSVVLVSCVSPCRPSVSCWLWVLGVESTEPCGLVKAVAG
jgi:hypothetical protein